VKFDAMPGLIVDPVGIAAAAVAGAFASVAAMSDMVFS
jgi:hypothetical protein